MYMAGKSRPAEEVGVPTAGGCYLIKQLIQDVMQQAYRPSASAQKKPQPEDGRD